MFIGEFPSLKIWRPLQTFLKLVMSLSIGWKYIYMCFYVGHRERHACRHRYMYHWLVKIQTKASGLIKIGDQYQYYMCFNWYTISSSLVFNFQGYLNGISWNLHFSRKSLKSVQIHYSDIKHLKGYLWHSSVLCRTLLKCQSHNSFTHSVKWGILLRQTLLLKSAL